MLTTLATQAAAMHPGGWHDGNAPAFWPVFPITFGLFWLAVLGTVFYLIRRRTGGGTATATAPDPLAKARSVLAERFARGEIDEDEYLRRTSTLNTD
ncbi:SHOCT domain-containing protein [Actinomadura chokoriensis]|uniref:SHOCT domain-containing protein n=1 Tax=Actinomadura chokoriensis TaxID=454156 RepID=A0ABV4R8S9_9ACTN